MLKASKNGKVHEPRMSVYKVVEELQALQRQWVILTKSRIMQSNRLQAIVAGSLGYCARLTESERLKLFGEAATVIEQVMEGQPAPQPYLESVIKATRTGIDAFQEQLDRNEKEIVKVAKQLPDRIHEWLEHPDQDGFGWKSLGRVLGETGNLHGYTGPAKVCKRMGLQPFTSDGKTYMASTWKMKRFGSLSAAEWVEYGYSPRRRSLMYVVGESLLKRGGTGPYRQKYLAAKVQAYKLHPDWKEWKDCDKEDCKNGKVGKGLCNTCGGTGKKCLRAHRHGMLLATKLLLKNLWVVWNT